MAEVKGSAENVSENAECVTFCLNLGEVELGSVCFTRLSGITPCPSRHYYLPFSAVSFLFSPVSWFGLEGPFKIM